MKSESLGLESSSDPASSVPKKTEISSVPPKKVESTRRPIFKIVGLITAALVLAFIVYSIHESMDVISTDDAYVNSYVTFVAPRVTDQVVQVLVDDNNRVKKGDILVQLDPEPYRVKLEIKNTALNTSQANLVMTEASIRGLVAQARSQRFKLTHAIEDVDNQVALIRQRAATWEKSKATLALAQTEFTRAKNLLTANAVSTQEYDTKREQLEVAQDQVVEALENVHQARAALGLPVDPPSGTSLTDVPPDLDQTFSSVRQALADLLNVAAQIGVFPSSYNLTPRQVLEEFYKRDPSGDIDRIYAEIFKEAPSLKQAQAAVVQAQREVDQANLDLTYCTIHAEIDGVVTRRNVNPGNYVQVGQSLMAVRSLKEIWIDANFKETELRDLRIGQHVAFKTDFYGAQKKFEGRISGFTMGTGSTLALLPAQNATGNFVKVVQRLPVRIDLLNYDPEHYPLFVGISVEPIVDIKSAPTGPNAGKFLQDSPAPILDPPKQP